MGMVRYKNTYKKTSKYVVSFIRVAVELSISPHLWFRGSVIVSILYVCDMFLA